MKMDKANQIKRFLSAAFLAVLMLLLVFTGLLPSWCREQIAQAEGAPIVLAVESTQILAGTANPEFTVTMKMSNNTYSLFGASITITPLDDNIDYGTTAENYTKNGAPWVQSSAKLETKNGKTNIVINGITTSGLTQNSFVHGAYKFKYKGTPSGPINFCISYNSVATINTQKVEVSYNGELLKSDKTDNTTTNYSVTPYTPDTVNTLSALSLSVGGTQLVSGTSDSQTATEHVAYTDRANVAISATRAREKSKIKVTEGSKTLVSERESDLTNQPLGTLEQDDHTITVTVTSESGVAKTYKITFTVDQKVAEPISKPAAPATTTGKFSGSPIDFTPDGMAALVSKGKVSLFKADGSTPATINDFKPTNAGSYKIIARPTSDYAWSDGSSDAEYTFSVGKATITAVAGAEDELPTFTSDSYTGTLKDNVVVFKYYSDEACTNEISPGALQVGTKYYAKPTLKAGMENNFEFSSDAYTQNVTSKGSSYVPTIQLTPITKPAVVGATNGKFTGAPIDFIPSGMADLVSKGQVQLFAVDSNGVETVADINAFKPTNAGTYKVIARPAEGFCWVGGDTADAEYTFSVSKATLTASDGGDGKLPVFKSDSYKGSLDDILEYKYYSDEACTQEVKQSDLTVGTTYYVKPTLKDGMDANFEFAADTYTHGVVDSGTEYVHTKKGIPFWVWIIVAVFVLILAFVLFVLISRRRRDKQTKTATATNYAAGGAQPYQQQQQYQQYQPYQAQPQPERVVTRQVITPNVDTKADRLEDRLHELEKETHERELARYKEEAQRAAVERAAAERTAEREAAVRAAEREAAERAAAEKAAAERAAAERVAAERAAAERAAADRAAAERAAERAAAERAAAEREAAERAKREAERAADDRYYAQSRASAPATGSSGDSDRIKELEARIREMERDAREVERSAHDRELDRYKDDVEQARREADRTRQEMLFGQQQRPAAGGSADSDRVKELEARLREMERDVRDAERVRMDPYYGQQRAVANNSGDSERVKELEARLREMEKESHEKEIARYKEEAEAAKRAAEERFYAKHPMPDPTYVPYRANDDMSSPYIKKLEEQLRRMEQESHERELERYRSEAERAKREAEDLSRRSRQQEEELKRLRDLQLMEQRSREIITSRGSSSGRSENDMLQRMEEQMRRQNSELQSLTDELQRRLAAMQGRKY